MYSELNTTDRLNNKKGTKQQRQEEEKVEVWRGVEEIMNGSISVMQHTKNVYCSCIDASGPQAILQQAVREAHYDLKKRRIKARFITEITKDNLAYCKEIMKCGELRHLDGIKGNFAIADSKEYGCIPNPLPLTEFIYSNMQTFVKQQQFFFETLWSKAIPARQRIREIEQGVKREFEETVRDPSEIRQIQRELLESAQHEVLMIFPTVNEFCRELFQGQYTNNYQQRQEQLQTTSLIELLKEAAKNRDVNIRILVYSDAYHHHPNMQELLQELKKFPVQIRVINNKQDDKEKHLQTKLITLIVDNESSLTIDLRDQSDNNDSSGNNNNNNNNYDVQDAAAADDDGSIGLATYTNSEARIETFSSMFEILWIQSEKNSSNSSSLIAHADDHSNKVKNYELAE